MKETAGAWGLDAEKSRLAFDPGMDSPRQPETEWGEPLGCSKVSFITSGPAQIATPAIGPNLFVLNWQNPA